METRFKRSQILEINYFYNLLKKLRNSVVQKEEFLSKLKSQYTDTYLLGVISIGVLVHITLD